MLYTHAHTVNKRQQDLDEIFAKLRDTIIHIKFRNHYICLSLYSDICVSSIIKKQTCSS